MGLSVVSGIGLCVLYLLLTIAPCRQAGRRLVGAHEQGDGVQEAGDADARRAGADHASHPQGGHAGAGGAGAHRVSSACVCMCVCVWWGVCVCVCARV